MTVVSGGRPWGVQELGSPARLTCPSVWTLACLGCSVGWVGSTGMGHWTGGARHSVLCCRALGLVQELGHLWGPRQDSAPLLVLWLPPFSLLSVSPFPFILACSNLPRSEPG